MREMKTINISKRSKYRVLHIEAPGCIINIRCGLTRSDGCEATRIDVSADGDRYTGDPQAWIEIDESGHVPSDKTGATVLVIRDASRVRKTGRRFPRAA